MDSTKNIGNQHLIDYFSESTARGRQRNPDMNTRFKNKKRPVIWDISPRGANKRRKTNTTDEVPVYAPTARVSSIAATANSVTDPTQAQEQARLDTPKAGQSSKAVTRILGADQSQPTKAETNTNTIKESILAAFAHPQTTQLQLQQVETNTGTTGGAYDAATINSRTVQSQITHPWLRNPTLPSLSRQRDPTLPQVSPANYLRMTSFPTSLFTL
jgi:hypothetical protein